MVIHALIFSVMPRTMGLSSQPVAFTSNLAWLLRVLDSCCACAAAAEQQQQIENQVNGGEVCVCPDRRSVGHVAIKTHVQICLSELAASSLTEHACCCVQFTGTGTPGTLGLSSKCRRDFTLPMRKRSAGSGTEEASFTPPNRLPTPHVCRLHLKK